MIVAYTGTSDFQEFDKNDFAKADIEDAKKMQFARGEATEVDDAIGEALIAKDGIFGDYSFVKIEVEGNDLSDPVVAAAADAEGQKRADKAAAKAAQDGGAPSISASGGSTQTAVSPSSSGTGTSTPAPRG